MTEDMKLPTVKKPTVDPRRQRAAATLFLVLICAFAGFGGGYLGANAHFQLSPSSTNPAITKENQRAALNESELISAIAKNVAPSVVSIDGTGQEHCQWQ